MSLNNPGDTIEYQITVANQGTLDAIIENIETTETTETENSALLFEVSGINKGDKLAKSTTTTFNIKISYDESITSQPEELNKTLIINITYVQDMGQVIEPENYYSLTYVPSSYDQYSSYFTISINGVTYDFGEDIFNIPPNSVITIQRNIVDNYVLHINVGSDSFMFFGNESINYTISENITYRIYSVGNHSG